MNIFKSLLAGLLFVTLCMAQNGTQSEMVRDIDGNIYHTVKIGTQTWTVENLHASRYNDSSPIPLVTEAVEWRNLSSDAFCYYNNTGNADSNYGALYNGYSVSTGKLAPVGWHVPTKDDWKTLENYLSGKRKKIAKALAAKTGWETCKESGAIGNKSAKNNVSGFSALPGGFRHRDGSFREIGKTGCWWSSTPGKESDALRCKLYFYFDYIDENYFHELYGFSVRLVKD